MSSNRNLNTPVSKTRNPSDTATLNGTRKRTVVRVYLLGRSNHRNITVHVVKKANELTVPARTANNFVADGRRPPHSISFFFYQPNQNTADYCVSPRPRTPIGRSFRTTVIMVSIAVHGINGYALRNANTRLPTMRCDRRSRYFYVGKIRIK